MTWIESVICEILTSERQKRGKKKHQLKYQMVLYEGMQVKVLDLLFRNLVRNLADCFSLLFQTLLLSLLEPVQLALLLRR